MIQIDRKFKDKNYPILIAVSHIEELSTMEKVENGIITGAAVTVAKLKQYLELCVKSLPTHQVSTYYALLNQLNNFGSQQIRNVATIGGNIIHASPISTLNPVLYACDAKLKLIKCNNNEQYEISVREFFLSKRKDVIEPDEILLSIYIPFSEKHQYVHSYKQSRRRKLDIPIISCAFQVKLEHMQSQIDGFAPEYKWKIQSMCLSLGSMTSTTVMMDKTQDYLKDKPWCKQTIRGAIKCLQNELLLNEFTPGGQPEYR